MSDFPRSLKWVTVWLVLGVLLFLGVQAWQARQQAARIQVMGQVVELRRSPDGHFHWPGQVNGQAVEFLVDTGATRTALPLALAEGLERRRAVPSSTAGGPVLGHEVRVDLELQGGLQVIQLPVTVLPNLATPLLGMDVLSRLRFTQSGGVLRLEPSR